ncbi:MULTISPECIES: hypothetical protein [unclassified Caballeronia]|uniref:hypothetical protein n=1 Tax=unclassified Caballeronia TaxID=2646786 RepID=UPI002855A350|nr:MULTISPECIES: hypothetical protein [unclassified Caballeronia]MDR5777676.1 hypothetical protein [Caballeronia sp. LZ002]MDR5853114.1 hypothetical protein [Caballeronia sp. LZ003]
MSEVKAEHMNVINQRNLACHFLSALALMCFALHADAIGIPAAVQTAVDTHMDANHKLQSPIIDAGPAMEGVYIYFVTNTSDEPGYTKNNRPYILDAFLLFSDANHLWHHLLFDRYIKDDGVPEISTVFFMNADHNSGDKEVVILVRTPLEHYDYGGEYYDGYVYKLRGNALKGAVFAGLQIDASAPFMDQCECDSRNGKSSHALYKDAESMRKVLAKKYPVIPR